MILRVLLAALAIWGMTWSKEATAVAYSGPGWSCTSGTVNSGGIDYVYTYCFVEGGGGGGGYGTYEPISGGGGGGTGLPPKIGYKVVGNVYVRLDRKQILAQHAYSCETEHELLVNVAGWSGGTTVGWQVEIELADGKSQTWVRTNTSSYGWAPISPCQ